MKTIVKQDIETGILKSLALMDHLREPYYLHDGIYYVGKEYDEDSEEVEEYDEENYNNDYLVLTDEEADEKANEQIKESLWAFNPSFLSEMTDFDQEIFEAIQSNGKCESNNDVIYNTITKTCGIKDFCEAAIQADGRGHFMSSYDGQENEETVNGESFYIYRVN